MNRLRLVLVGIAALLLVSSCAVVDPPALTVDDWSLSRSEFLDQLDAIQSSPELVVLLGQTATTTTSEPSSLQTSATAALLTAHVQGRLFAQLAAELDIEPLSQDELDQAMAGLQFEVPETVRPVVESALTVQMLDQRLQEALLGDFDAEAEARQVYQEALDAGQLADEVCIDIIVTSATSADPTDPTAGATPTPEAVEDARTRADDIHERLDAGEDFTELATAESDDPSAADGGDVGCVPEDQINPDIGVAVGLTDVGAYTDVLDFTTDFVIIRVTSRGPASFESFLSLYQQQNGADLIQSLVQTHVAEQAQPLLERVAGELEVAVDPLFGRWDPEQITVLTPEGAAGPPLTLGGDLFEEPTAVTDLGG